jgi:hypothetical protein
VDLSDLLGIEGVAVEPSSICLMRHTDRELGDYLLDPSVFRFYTSVQKRGRLDRHRYVMAFVVNGAGKTIFRGMYEIYGKSPLSPEHLRSLFLPEHLIAQYKSLCKSDEYDFYSINPAPFLSPYEGRLVIDWGKANIVWFQTFSSERPKKVLEILPEGFFRPFDGYSAVSLTRPELEFLYANENANLEWAGHLSRVSGIYLILDERKGDQYIGSASGRRGIWGRWSNYFDDPSGGNMMLKSILENEPDAYKHFRYSILEVMPGNSVTSEVIAKETLYKKMLGTRAHGLNLN